ncbi:hypothetical protein [Litorimonas haliclonae]|uniref:hypothetical protein n=1 Tax=Litorimonas haliclonae TaxID=2081977 RepID=UPI0039EFA4F3
MTFEDRISLREPLPDLAPLRTQYTLLCAQLLAAIIYPDAALTLARQLRRHVRGMIQASQAHFRSRQKMAMLLRTDWRERVISELGGWSRLRLWTYRQEALEVVPPSKTYKPPDHPAPDAEEFERRARMRELMKASIHPRILRDPCRMDFDGWFRLPPQIRLKNPINEHPQYYDYEYDFDPRPVANFTGIKIPITVWPEEFRAAAEVRPAMDEREREEELASIKVVTPDTDPGSLPSQQLGYCRGSPIFPPVPNDNVPIVAPKRIPAQGRDDKGQENERKPYASRAPPRIRGSPKTVLRQAPLGGALSCGVI